MTKPTHLNLEREEKQGFGIQITWRRSVWLARRRFSQEPKLSFSYNESKSENYFWVNEGKLSGNCSAKS